MTENLIKYIVIILLTGLLFIYLIAVLYKLQISNHKSYIDTRTIQNGYVSTERKRGTIFGTFKNGEIFPLAQDQVLYRLVLSPKDIPSEYENRLFTLLNGITELDKDKFFKSLKNKKDAHEEIKIINEKERGEIEELGIQGVLTYQTFKRKYPLHLVGARTIGFVGGGDNGFVGRYGLEKYYETDLQGKESVKVSFFTKIFEQNQKKSDNKLSKNIITSLEPNVMKFVNQTLADMKVSWEADQVSAIIMNVNTGEIIAMETLPTYDPNNYQNFDIKDFNNPVIQGVYELGSIMKPITLSGAIDANLITPSTVYHDYGFLKIDDYIIKNFDGKVRGDQTMQELISNSLNTGAVYVQRLMGMEKFKENFIKFGLEKDTGIDFPGEVSNKVANLNTKTQVNYANAAFGQGVAITPISMINALNIIPNAGRTTCPHFISHKVFQNGDKVAFECADSIVQVISTTTARTMNDMLVELVDSGLGNGKYKDSNYKVGAKTGTAQIPSPDGKYYKDKFVHSYYTFFPADNPRFSVLIYQVNPKKGILASITLAPIANKMKDFLLTYYNIPPDRK